MKRHVFAVALAVVFWTSTAPSWAQVPGYRPPVSPYVNLGQRNFQGNSPGIIYYGIVRPQLEFGNSISQLQRQQAVQGQEIATQEQASTLPPTGHPVGFLNHSSYFLNLQFQSPRGRQPFVVTSTPAATRPGSGA